MPHLGIMLEGQEGLTWERFFRLAEAVEDLGFESLFRSDHLTALGGDSRRASLALWPSLAALAARTRRIRFGPLVCSITFHHPALLAKNAAAVDRLSGGRFELGLGAGWYAGEHRKFGVNYPPYAARLEMLDEGAQVVQALFAGGPVTFSGKHYSLVEAETYPLPVQRPLPVIMGGKGERTPRVVAKYASEWNCSYVGLEVFTVKSRELDQDCLAIGRDPSAIRRSLMLPFVIGRDPAAVQTRIDAKRATFPDLPADLAAWNVAGFVGGSPDQLLATNCTAGRRPAAPALCSSTATWRTWIRWRCWRKRCCRICDKSQDPKSAFKNYPCRDIRTRAGLQDDQTHANLPERLE